jgi:hypothetical protein
MRAVQASLVRPFAIAVCAVIVAFPLAAQLVTEPAWGFSFSPPPGWKIQKDSNGALLGHATIAGLIMVFPHSASSLSDLRAEMLKGISEQAVQLGLAAEPKPLGKNALSAECKGFANGQEVVGRAIGALSPYGGGAIVIAITTPQAYGKDLAAAAEKIVMGMQFPKTDAAAVARALAGSWSSVSASSQSQFTLGADGRFSEYSESTHSGNFSDQYGNDTGNWGAGGAQQGSGTWSARGTREKGSIQFLYNDGKRSSYEYRVHVENGTVYWNEYYFGGVLYGKSQ